MTTAQGPGLLETAFGPRGTRIIMRAWPALPVIVALLTVWWSWHEYGSNPLEFDPTEFLEIADSFSWRTWWGGIREPVWSTLLAGPVAIFGATAPVIRVFGVAGFLLLVVAMQGVSSRVLGRHWGVLAGLMIAASPWLGFQALRGLREEAAAAAILIFGYAVSRQRSSATRFVWLAAAAALMALLRWDSILFTVPLLIILAVLERVPWRQLIAAGVIFFALLAPLLIGNQVRFDDALYHSNIHAVFFRNVEFQNEPGVPTTAELQANGLRYGPHETWFEYLFERHSLNELGRRSLRGTLQTGLTVTSLGFFFPDGPVVEAEVPSLDVLRSVGTIIPWLVVTSGLFGALLLFRRGYWPLALLIPLSLIQHAPIAHLMDPRLSLAVFPLLVLGVLETLRSAVEWSGMRRAGEPGVASPTEIPED